MWSGPPLHHDHRQPPKRQKESGRTSRQWCLSRCGAGWWGWMKSFSERERIKVKLRTGKAWSALSKWGSSLAVKLFQRAYCKCPLAQCVKPRGPLSLCVTPPLMWPLTNTDLHTGTYFLLTQFFYFSLNILFFPPSNTVQPLPISRLHAFLQ